MKVAQHEQESGWHQAKARVKQLDQAISESATTRPISPPRLVTANAMMLCGVVALGIVGVYGTTDGLGCLLIALLLPLAWAGWTTWLGHEQRIRRRLIDERRLLQLKSGCGDPRCTRCL